MKECTHAETSLGPGICRGDLRKHPCHDTRLSMVGLRRFPILWILRILYASCVQLRACPMGLPLVLSTRLLRRFLLSSPRVGMALVGWTPVGLGRPRLGLARWLGAALVA